MLSEQALLAVGEEMDEAEDEDHEQNLGETIAENIAKIDDALETGVQNTKQNVTDLIELAKLEDSREWARVAILLEDDVPRPWTPPESLHKVSEANVLYLDKPRLLVVVSLPKEERRETATQQMARLRQICLDDEKLVRDELWAWPLHHRKTVQMLGAKVLFDKDSCGCFGILSCPFSLRRLFGDVHAPRQNAEIISLAAKHYGGSIAFPFAWTRHYTRNLWVFMFIVLGPAVALGVNLSSGLMAVPISSATLGTAEHILWELIKVISVVWMLLVAKNWNSPDLSGGMKPMPPRAVENWSPRCGGETGAIVLCVFVTILVVAIELIIAMLLFCFVFWLELYLAFEWGDCINLGCRDPAVKWGFLGWLVSITPGILEAIFLAIFTEVSILLADLLLKVRNYQYHESQLRFKFVALLSLEAVAKLGTFGILAMLFVPEWEDELQLSGLPSNYTSMSETERRIARNSITCEGLPDADILGRGALLCMRRRLDASYRRWLLEKAMKGPFVVAPFIAILIKVLLPILLQYLGRCFWRCERRASRGEEQHCCLKCGVCQFIMRAAGLIFAYDGPKIGCFSFLFKGNPFKFGHQLKDAVEADVEPKDLQPAGGAGAARADEERGKRKVRPLNPMAPIRQALREVIEKRFAPENVVLDNLLSIQWVGFFTVIWPWGCIPTVLAWVLQTRSAWATLLISKRRVFPEMPDMLEGVSTYFVFIMAHLTCAWQVALSLVTYNTKLYTMSGGTVAGLFIGLWAAAVAVMWLVAEVVHRVFDAINQRCHPEREEEEEKAKRRGDIAGLAGLGVKETTPHRDII